MGKSGKAMPCDAEPCNTWTPLGVGADGHEQRVVVCSEAGDDGVVCTGLLIARVPHWATCPHANSHRKPKDIQRSFTEEVPT
jgi:hypothetical protein